MSQQLINTGLADKGNGDPIRTAFTKVNENFAELYNHVSAGVVAGNTAPTDPGEGDLWWDSESGRIYVYYGSTWVDASPVDGAGISSTNELVNGAHTVSLGTDGKLTFPDSTVQTTAWTGSTDRLTSTGTSVVLNKDQYNTSRLTFTGSATIETAGYLSGSGGLALVNSSSQQYVIVKSDRVQINTGFPDQGTGLQSYNDWQFLKSGVFKLPTTGIIENSGKQWVFGLAGNLTVPGTISKTNILQLNSSGTGGGAGKAASVSIDGNNGRLLVRTSDDVANKDWIFDIDGFTMNPGPVGLGNSTNYFVKSAFKEGSPWSRLHKPGVVVELRDPGAGDPLSSYELISKSLAYTVSTGSYPNSTREYNWNAYLKTPGTATDQFTAAVVINGLSLEDEGWAAAHPADTNTYKLEITTGTLISIGLQQYTFAQQWNITKSGGGIIASNYLTQVQPSLPPGWIADQTPIELVPNNLPAGCQVWKSFGTAFATNNGARDYVIEAVYVNITATENLDLSLWVGSAPLATASAAFTSDLTGIAFNEAMGAGTIFSDNGVEIISQGNTYAFSDALSIPNGSLSVNINGSVYLNGGGGVLSETIYGAVAIGAEAGGNGMGDLSVAIGRSAGTQAGKYSVAVGYWAGHTSQGESTVAIGNAAGQDSQGSNAVAIGHSAGSETQGSDAVAIGTNAGALYQGINSIAIGQDAGFGFGGGYGYYNPTGSSGTTLNITAPEGGFNYTPVPGMLVRGTGFSTQTIVSVNSATQVILSAPPDSTPGAVIEFYAAQGDNSIAIGRGAGYGAYQSPFTIRPQAARTIILNASGNNLNGVLQQTDSFYVNPIRNADGTSGVLQYNATTKEVTYSNTISNLTGVGTESVAGSQIDVGFAKTIITNGITNSLGGPSLTSRSIVDVGDGKVVMAFQVINDLGGDPSLTEQKQIEVSSDHVLIGQKLINTLGASTLSTFSGWTFDDANSALTLPSHGIVGGAASASGLTREIYSGYPYFSTGTFADTTTWFNDGRTPTNTSVVNPATFFWDGAYDAENPQSGPPPNTSWKLTGYFIPPVSGVYDVIAACNDHGWVSINGVNSTSENQAATTTLIKNIPYLLTVYFTNTNTNGTLNLQWKNNYTQLVYTSDFSGLVVTDIAVEITASNRATWTFGADGTTTFPIGVSIDYGGGNNVQYPRIIATSGKSFSVQGQGSTGSAALAWSVDPDSAGQYAQIGVTKEGGDNLAKVILQAQSDSGDAATAKTWKFDETGTLTLPATGLIDAATTATLTVGDAFYTTYLEAEQLWVDTRDYDASTIAPATRPWAGMPSHLAYPILLAYTPPGGLTFPGSDMAPKANTAKNAYNDLAATNVKIKVSGKEWTFGSYGALTLPDASVITSYKPVTVIAKPAVTQTINDGASAAGLIFVETVDSASAFSNGVFTVPYTGYYQFNVTLAFATEISLTAGFLQIANITSGITALDSVFYGPFSGQVINGSSMLELTAGNTIALFFNQTSGAPIDISTLSRLTIHRVSIS